MSDLISRQAAIDTCEHHKTEGLVCKNAAIAMCVDSIMALPSAQPEIIRCKDCKHFHYDMPYVIQGIPVLGHEVCNAWGDGCKTDENGWCFLAERANDGR